MAPEFYWVNFVADGREGAAEVTTRELLTRGEHVSDVGDLLTHQSGSRHVLVRGWNHLRSDPDEEG